MPNLAQTHYHLNLLDELSRRDVRFNRIHPFVQLLVAFIYLLVTVSFGSYEPGRLLPLSLYPLSVLILADIPAKPVLLRLAAALPFFIGIGLLNPIFDSHPVYIGGVTLSKGWVSFISLLMKGAFSVMAAILLLSTCGLTRLARCLRLVGIPRILVLQLFLTYRYLSVLLEEVARTLTAYHFRAPGHKGLSYKAWGPLVGQLLLRTFDRAERIYQAMRLRGFEGDYPDAPLGRIEHKDLAFGLFWASYLTLVRAVDIPGFLGGLA